MAGRKPHEPTEKTQAEVLALVGFGVSHEDIAKYQGIDAKTLRKHYRDELDQGVIKANAAVAKSLYNQAVNGKSTVAAIFWLKTRARWRETSSAEDQDREVQPLSISFNVKEPVGEIKVTNAKP